MAFVQHAPGNTAIITSLARAVDALRGTAGTVITG
jgi:carbamate kinase